MLPRVIFNFDACKHDLLFIANIVFNFIQRRKNIFLKVWVQKHCNWSSRCLPFKSFKNHAKFPETNKTALQKKNVTVRACGRVLLADQRTNKPFMCCRRVFFLHTKINCSTCVAITMCKLGIGF